MLLIDALFNYLATCCIDVGYPSSASICRLNLLLISSDG